jgi:2-methylisocitrate lyase-like PEP mutase family enzyme
VLRRGEQYLKAGADGFYVDGIRNVEEMEIIGREFRGVPLATSILEGGGQTPWVAPQRMHELGFSMILYPTTVLFRMTRAMQRALADLKAGHPMPRSQSVTMSEFEKIVDIAYWKAVEQQVIPLSERMHQVINRIYKRIA